MPTDGTLLLELKDVHVAYRGSSGQEVLAGITGQVHAGDSLAIVGPSGTGKTTLLRVLVGELPATRGAVDYHFDVREPGQFGYVSQSNSLLPWLTLHENVRFPLRVLKRQGDHAASVREVLGEVGLDRHEWKYPHELSGGMARRAVLARTLVCQPRFLLLDEPLGGLDAVTRNRMIDLLLALRTKHGFTQICVEHDLSAAARLADRFWVLPGPGAPAEAIDFRPRGRGASGLPPPLEERVLLVESRLAAVAEKWDEPVQGRMSR